MPECDYCGASLGDEDAYLSHLAGEHEGELSAIDQRRVADHDDDGGFPVCPVVLVGLLGLAGGLVIWVTFFMGVGGGSSEGAGAFSDPVQSPSNVGGVHSHGSITVEIGGEQLDFSRDRYQLQADGFHFEGGRGDRYHVHAQGVTLEFALESLGIGVQQGLLEFEGTVYNESNGDTVVYEVNGESVNPETYTLQESDSVRVVARKGS